MQHRIEANGHELLLIDYPKDATSFRLVSREDEVEKLAKEFFDDYDDSKVKDRSHKEGFMDGYRTAKEKTSYSEDQVIEFPTWLRHNYAPHETDENYWVDADGGEFMTETLFEEYKAHLDSLPKNSIQFIAEGEKYFKVASVDDELPKNDSHLWAYSEDYDKYGEAIYRDESFWSITIPNGELTQSEFTDSITHWLKEVTLQNTIIETVPLPEGSVILGEIDGGKVDFDCSEFCELMKVDGWGSGYKDYEYEKEVGGAENFRKDFLLRGDAEKSFLSLLKSQSIDTEKHYLVIQISEHEVQSKS